MPDINNLGSATLIDAVMRRYDDMLRRNATDVYDVVRAVLVESDEVSGIPVGALRIAESLGAPTDDRKFIASLGSAADQYQATLRKELRAHLGTTTLAATEVELAAAEAAAQVIAAELDQRGVVGLDQVKDSVRDHMAAQGLDLEDLPSPEWPSRSTCYSHPTWSPSTGAATRSAAATATAAWSTTTCARPTATSSTPNAAASSSAQNVRPTPTGSTSATS